MSPPSLRIPDILFETAAVALFRDAHPGSDWAEAPEATRAQCRHHARVAINAYEQHLERLQQHIVRAQVIHGDHSNAIQEILHTHDVVSGRNAS
jgi:hypothetical protein